MRTTGRRRPDRGRALTLLVSVLLVPSLGAPLSAQEAAPPHSTSRYEESLNAPASRPVLLASVPDSVMRQQDYRWEGLIIGAAALGLAAGAVGYGLCSESESNDSHCIGNAIGGFFVGGIVGGTLGLFIGRVVPKRQ